MVIAAGSVMNEPSTRVQSSVLKPTTQQDYGHLNLQQGQATVLQTLQRVLLRQWP